MNKVNAKFKYYQNLKHFFIVLFVLCFSLQFFFWLKAEKFKPGVGIVPSLPSEKTVAAMSFGDSQFYFRLNALRIENAGDSFGRFTSLKQYNYQDLYNWFKLLENLDPKSQYIPALAANYYSQTPNKEDTRYIVKYLDEYASRDIDQYWWWMFQALYIASATLKDNALALDLANKLSENKNPNAPIWTRQYPAFIKARMGDDCGAFLVINNILQESSGADSKISPEELYFMHYFIKERLANLKEKNFDPRKCQMVNKSENAIKKLN